MTTPTPAYAWGIDPPPRRGNRTVITVVIGIAACVVLLACAIPVYGFVRFMFFGPMVSDAEAVAGTYFEKLTAGDDAGAYAMLCPEARQTTDLASFTGLVDAAPRPTSRTVTAGRFLGEAATRADVDVRLTTGGASRLITVTMTSSDGDWQVCGDTLI